MKNTSNNERPGVFVSLQDLSELRAELREGINRIENKLSTIPATGQEENYLTVKEAADFLKCSTATIQRIKNSGTIQFTSISGKLLVKKSDIIKALDAGTITI
jgi:excisionase family DNA binding protein